MNKVLILVIIAIIAYFISCQTPTPALEDQQKCNMFIGASKVEDCTGISVGGSFKCCAEYFRVVTMNILACKYILNDEEKIQDEKRLLQDTYNAKNVSIICSGNSYAISSLLVLFALLF